MNSLFSTTPGHLGKNNVTLKNASPLFKLLSMIFVQLSKNKI